MKGYKKEKLESLKREAIALYGANFSTREIGEKLGKSRTWVWLVIQENSRKLDNVSDSDKMEIEK